MKNQKTDQLAEWKTPTLDFFKSQTTRGGGAGSIAEGASMDPGYKTGS